MPSSLLWPLIVRNRVFISLRIKVLKKSNARKQCTQCFKIKISNTSSTINTLTQNSFEKYFKLKKDIYMFYSPTEGPVEFNVRMIKKGKQCVQAINYVLIKT